MKIKVQKLLNSIETGDSLYESKCAYLQYLIDTKKKPSISERILVIDLDDKDTVHGYDEIIRALIRNIPDVTLICFNTNNAKSRLIHHINDSHSNNGYTIIGNPYDNTNILLAKSKEV